MGSPSMMTHNWGPSLYWVFKIKLKLKKVYYGKYISSQDILKLKPNRVYLPHDIVYVPNTILLSVIAFH